MYLTLLILLPVTVFALVFLFFVALSRLTEKMAYKSCNNPKGKFESYACGEDVAEHRIKPDYAQFFPIAFFFTIMHVITLMIATSPESVMDILGISALFLITAYISILIIFRRDREDD